MTDEQFEALKKREAAAYESYRMADDKAKEAASAWVPLRRSISAEEMRREIIAQIATETK
jgi:hypothetical protein